MASSAENVGPVEINGSKKRTFEERGDGRGSYRFKNKKQKKADQLPGANGTKFTGSNEEVLLEDVRQLLEKHKPQNDSLDETGVQSNTELPRLFEELELEVTQLSSTGDGLAVSKDGKHVFAIPFTAPEDRVIAKPFKHFAKEGYSLADFVKITKPSPHRDDSLVKCPYFATCSGCQFQMLPYSYQLSHKRRIVENAYRNFSNLPASVVPEVGETIGSPMQYGYRTKLTPHFDGPPGQKRSDGRNGIKRVFEEVPPIGFMKKGTRTTIDIEDCPIGTDAVRLGMKTERKRVADELSKYKRGATLLLRENTVRVAKDAPYDTAGPGSELVAVEEGRAIAVPYDDQSVDVKSCITDSNATSTEKVGEFTFQNPAGAFFQNNNSILPRFTQYIRDHILPPASSKPSGSPPKKLNYLIDAYSGSGLFTITLSSLFKESIGIDISPQSISCATLNLSLNGISSDRAKFIAADASDLFASVDFPADETVVVIDPPRKGCDDGFLRQLVKFGPQRVVYVSCNVHTQARDVGMLVGGMDGGEGGYEMESLRGFDFFPQTGHVEGVAVLRRKASTEEGSKTS